MLPSGACWALGLHDMCGAAGVWLCSQHRALWATQQSSLLSKLSFASFRKALVSS